MERLNLVGLRDAGLMTLRHPHLVERYNAALEAMTERRTALTEFRIDATGFSPEIAEEFGDQDYMNPHGVNLRYILVHLGQRDLVVLGARFTTARRIMRSFIENNREALFTLTTKTAVHGEFEDGTYKVRDIEDLLSIRRISISVATATGIAEKARRLTDMAAAFPTSDSMWLDEEAVSTMCAYARDVGDVRRNQCVPQDLVFDKGNFHSSHLGGVYVFRDQDGITVLHQAESLQAPMTWQGKPVRLIPVSAADRVVQYLLDHRLIVPPTDDCILARRETLLRKLEFLVIDHVSEQEPSADLTEIDFDETKRLIYKHHDSLPLEFHQISRALKFVSNGLDWDSSQLGAAAVAYTAIARPGLDRDLVNHLLAHLTPADYLGAFAANNPLFLERYAAWPEARRGYVSAFLRRRLSGRSAALFDAVFGADDTAEPWDSAA